MHQGFGQMKDKMGNFHIKGSAIEGKSAQSLTRKSPSPREINRLEEETFHTMLSLERRRAERSRRPFVLMLLDAHALFQNGNSNQLLEQLTAALLAASRETDLIGWYKKGGLLGVIFTEVTLPERDSITQVLLAKVVKALHERVDRQYASKVVITAHLFPENSNREEAGLSGDVTLYPDLTQQRSRKRRALIAKRAIDVV